VLVSCVGVVRVDGADRTVAAKAARRNAMGRCMVWISLTLLFEWARVGTGTWASKGA